MSQWVHLKYGLVRPTLLQWEDHVWSPDFCKVKSGVTFPHYDCEGDWDGETGEQVVRAWRGGDEHN